MSSKIREVVLGIDSLIIDRFLDPFIWRVEYHTGKNCYWWARLVIMLWPLTLAAILAVSLATPFLGNQYFERWFSMPRVLFTAQVPLVIAILTWRFVRSLRRNYELAPFVLTLAVFGLSYVGLGISMFPYLVPNSITLQMAAAPPSSQAFMLEFWLAATNDWFITTSPANNTSSPSTKNTVSPRVCVGPTTSIRTRTPPRSSVCSRSKVMSALRATAPARTSA